MRDSLQKSLQIPVFCLENEMGKPLLYIVKEPDVFKHPALILKANPVLGTFQSRVFLSF